MRCAEQQSAVLEQIKYAPDFGFQFTVIAEPDRRLNIKAAVYDKIIAVFFQIYIIIHSRGFLIWVHDVIPNIAYAVKRGHYVSVAVERQKYAAFFYRFRYFFMVREYKAAPYFVREKHTCLSPPVV